MSIRNKLRPTDYGLLGSSYYFLCLQSDAEQWSQNLRPIPAQLLTVQPEWPRCPVRALVEQFDPERAPEITRLWDPFENAFDDSGDSNPLIAARSIGPTGTSYFDTLFADAVDLKKSVS